MNGVQSNYYYAPEIGLPGMITDGGNPPYTYVEPAEEEIEVGRVVVKGADITEASTIFGYGVKLPVAASVSGDIVGIAVRVLPLKSSVPNQPDSTPIYEQKQPLTFLTRGSMWVKPVTDITAARSSVWVYTDDVTLAYPVGSFLGAEIVGESVQYLGAYFERQTAAGGIVKLVIP